MLGKREASGRTLYNAGSRRLGGCFSSMACAFHDIRFVGLDLFFLILPALQTVVLSGTSQNVAKQPLPQMLCALPAAQNVTGPNEDVRPSVRGDRGPPASLAFSFRSCRDLSCRTGSDTGLTGFPAEPATFEGSKKANGNPRGIE